MDSSPPPKTPTSAEIDELEEEFFSETEEDPNVFAIRNPLKEPLPQIFTTRQLHTLIHEGMIDLNPSYQREVVWPETKQIGLIDSIFRNFYVPPVVFAVQKDEDDEDVFICVDGKQRLTSIQKFFDGQIPHRDTKTKKNFWYTTSESSKGQRLEVPDFWKEEFSKKRITCVTYRNLAPGTEREIFQRVQLGMTLTAAEKLQAISSPWAQWIGELEARHVTVDGGLSHVLQWDTKRGRDYQNIAHMVYCCDGIPKQQLLPTAQKVEKWLSRVDEPGQQFKDDIERVLKDFWLIAHRKELNEGFTKIQQRVAPVEFLFVGVLLYTLRGASLEDRAKAIHILRKSVRSEFKDIRNNSVVGKAMWKHVGDLAVNPTSSGIFGGSSSSGKGRKKRKVDYSEVDEEYRPEPVRSLGKPLKIRPRPTKT